MVFIIGVAPSGVSRYSNEPLKEEVIVTAPSLMLSQLLVFVTIFSIVGELSSTLTISGEVTQSTSFCVLNTRE